MTNLFVVGYGMVMAKAFKSDRKLCNFIITRDLHEKLKLFSAVNNVSHQDILLSCVENGLKELYLKHNMEWYTFEVIKANN